MRATISGLALLLGACGSSVVPADAHDVSADAADVAPDGPPLGTCDTESIHEIASSQTVRFHFPLGVSAYLATAGVACEAMAIQRADGSSVTLGLPWACNCDATCPCDCPAVVAAVQTFVSLRDATTPTVMTWDGREMVTCTRYVGCSAMAGATVRYHQQTIGVPQPVAPGHYAATFLVWATLPTECREGPGGAGLCTTMPQPPYPAGYALCAAPGTLQAVRVEFDLPASGDSDVMVPVM